MGEAGTSGRVLSGAETRNSVEDQSASGQHRFKRQRQRQAKCNPAVQHLDAGADLQEAKPDGVELSSGQFGSIQEVGTQSVHEVISGAMKKEPEL